MRTERNGWRRIRSRRCRRLTCALLRDVKRAVGNSFGGARGWVDPGAGKSAVDDANGQLYDRDAVATWSASYTRGGAGVVLGSIRLISSPLRLS